MIEFFESVVGTFRITQPGSSVATSLVAGEAARKQVGILDIKGKNFRLHPVPLTQVRSFVTTELTLREHREELDPDDPKIESKITKVLEEEVRLMMMRAKEKTKELLRDARAAGNDAGENEGCIKYRLQDPDQVLVRIRVEHMGFASLNNQRFGAKFVGEVANPSDILLFHRKKDPKLASTVKTNRIQPIAPEELERTNMEDLVREQLAVPEGKLQIFGEKELSEALEDYVDKSLNGAISDVAIEVLDKTQKTLIKRKEGDKSIDRDSSVVESLERDDSQDVSIKEETREPMRKRKAVQPRSSGSQANSLQDDDLSSQRYVESSARTTTSTTRQREATHDDDSVDEHVEPTKKTATSRSKAVAPAKKRAPGKRKVPYSLDDSDEIDNGNNDEDELSDAIVDDDDELEDRGPKRPAKATKAAATKATKKTANVPRKTTTTGSSRRRSPPRKQQPQNSRRYFDDSDEQDDDDDDGKKKHHGESVELDVDWGSAATKTQRGGWS